MISVTRFHDISCGHRVVGHEGKCRHLHGHNYRFHFTIRSQTGTDEIGRVLDFGVIKSLLCAWLENNWDHKFLAWDQDKLMMEAYANFGVDADDQPVGEFGESFVFVPFNPTAENMAKFMVNEIGPRLLASTGTTLVQCKVGETAKCSATFSLEDM